MHLAKLVPNLIAMAIVGLSPLVAHASTPAPVVRQPALPPATLVKDINTATLSAFNLSAGPFSTSPNYAYFVASGDNQTISAWRTDGTEAGTIKIPHITGVKDTPDTIEIAGTLGDKALVTVSNWELVSYYYIRKSLNLWLTDGTDAGTKIIKESIGATDLISLHNNSYFIDTGTSGLWQVDPNTGNVSLAVAFGSPTRGHFVLNDVLYYVLSPNGPMELWRTNGTQSGTQQLAVLDIFNALNAQPAMASAMTQTLLPASRPSQKTPNRAKPDFGIPPPPITPKFAAISNTVYLRFDTILWKSDGTPAGTTLVSNQVGNENPSDQGPLLVLGNRLFFTASSSDTGGELWSSDGTTQGTALFKELVAGSLSSGPHLFTQVGGLFFFRATDANGNIGLWKSDGTVDGTQLATSTLWFNNAPPDELVAFNNKAYFLASDPQYGQQLWVSDGTSQGTQRVTAISVGSFTFAGPTGLATFGSHLLFTAESAATGRELWISDGTDAGTHLLKDINTASAGSNPYFVATALGKSFLVAQDSAHGRGLWTSNGSADGTQFLFDLPEEAFPDDVGYIGTVGSNAYFFNHGRTDYIWRTDGTITNTQLITQFVSDATVYSYPAITFNNQVYVVDRYHTLYRINPAQNDAITKVKDFAGVLNSDSLILSNGSLWIYEYLSEPFNATPRLWHSDGGDGVTLVYTFTNEIAVFDNFYPPPKMASLNGSTYFTHYGTNEGAALWKTDGTAAGTSTVKVLSDSLGVPVVNGILTTTQHLYVATGTDVTGQMCHYGCTYGQLWQSDGTLTHTIALTTSASSNITFTTLFPFAALSDSVIFMVREAYASVGDYHYSLWRVDDNTGAIEPLTSAVFSNLDATQIRIVNGTLYFRGNANQLWQTDGTAAGTKLLRKFSFPTTFAPTEIQLWQPLNDGILIGAFDGTTQMWSLWYATGGQVTQIPIQSKILAALAFTTTPTVQPFGNTVLFCGNTPQYGSELWRLDFIDAHNLSVQAVATQFATPDSASTLPITVFSERFGQVTTATLTATLPVSVTYLTDTLGLSPTLTGNDVVWHINNLAFGARDFTLQVSLPNTALGSRYPITFTLSTPLTDTTATDNTATTELQLTAQTFLPVMMR